MYMLTIEIEKLIEEMKVEEYKIAEHSCDARGLHEKFLLGFSYAIQFIQTKCDQLAEEEVENNFKAYQRILAQERAATYGEVIELTHKIDEVA